MISSKFMNFNIPSDYARAIQFYDILTPEFFDEFNINVTLKEFNSIEFQKELYRSLTSGSFKISNRAFLSNNKEYPNLQFTLDDNLEVVRYLKIFNIERALNYGSYREHLQEHVNRNANEYWPSDCGS